MENSERSIVIKPKGQHIVQILAPTIKAILVLLVFWFISHKQGGREDAVVIYGAVLIALAILAGVFFERARIRRATIRLATEGFYVGKRLYRWRYIESFGVAAGFFSGRIATPDMKAVFWNYTARAPYNGPLGKLSRLLFGYDRGLSAKYDIPHETIADMLNDWKTRQTGTDSEVINLIPEPRKRRPMTRNELIIGIGVGVIVFAVFISLMILAA